MSKVTEMFKHSKKRNNMSIQCDTIYEAVENAGKSGLKPNEVVGILVGCSIVQLQQWYTDDAEDILIKMIQALKNQRNQKKKVGDAVAKVLPMIKAD